MNSEVYHLNNNKIKFKGPHLLDLNDKGLFLPTNPIKECYKINYTHLKKKDNHHNYYNKQLKIIHDYHDHGNHHNNQSILNQKNCVDTNEILSQGDITIAKWTRLNSIQSITDIHAAEANNMNICRPHQNKPIPLPSEKLLTKESITNICTQKTEFLFHNIKFIDCLSALYDEMKVLEEIIDLLQSIGNKAEMFKMKKIHCQIKITIIEISIEQGTMSLNAYDSNIKKTLVNQNEILRKVNCNNGYPYKKYLQNRIGKRIEKILQERNEIEEMLLEKRAIDNELKYNDNEDSNKDDKDYYSNEQSIISFKGKDINSDQESVKEKIIKDICSLIKDYDKAYLYLELNKFEHKIKAKDMTTQLRILLNHINENKNININMYINNLPSAITPEFIYGHSKEHRHAIFSEILKDFKKNYDNSNGLYKTTKEHYQSFSKYLIDKYKEKIKTRLYYLQKKNNLNKQIYLKYSSAFLNEWCPAPIYQTALHEEIREIINKDIGENILEISIENILNPRKISMRLTYAIDIDTEQPVKKMLRSNAKKAIKDKSLYEIDKGAYEELYKKKIILELYESSGWFFCKKEWLAGELIVKLEELKHHACISKKLSFYKPPIINIYEDDSNKLKGDESIRSKIRDKHDVKIRITLRIRKSLIYPEEDKIQIMSKTVTDIYQPFIGEAIDGYQIPFNMEINFDNEKFQEEQRREVKESMLLNLNTPKVINKEQDLIKLSSNKKGEESKNNNQQWTNIQSIISPIDYNVQYDLKDFIPEELNDPQIESNLITCKVLDNAIMQLEQKMKKNEGKTPKPFRMRCSLLRAKKKRLEEMITTGDLSIGGYVTIIRTAINHDKKLQKYFQDNVLPQFDQIVTNRLKILINEMSDMLIVAKNACK